MTSNATLRGTNQRAILDYLELRASLWREWASRKDICEAAGLSPEAFYQAIASLVDHGVVGVKEDPYDGRRRLYRRRETT